MLCSFALVAVLASFCVAAFRVRSFLDVLLLAFRAFAAFVPLYCPAGHYLLLVHQDVFLRLPVDASRSCRLPSATHCSAAAPFTFSRCVSPCLFLLLLPSLPLGCLHLLPTCSLLHTRPLPAPSSLPCPPLLHSFPLPVFLADGVSFVSSGIYRCRARRIYRFLYLHLSQP